MNRDYLIEIAMDAYAEASGQSVSRPWMEAAFDAIAARIYDDGHADGYADGQADHYTPTNNRPYRTSEDQ